SVSPTIPKHPTRKSHAQRRQDLSDMSLSGIIDPCFPVGPRVSRGRDRSPCLEPYPVRKRPGRLRPAPDTLYMRPTHLGMFAAFPPGTRMAKFWSLSRREAPRASSPPAGGEADGAPPPGSLEEQVVAIIRRECPAFSPVDMHARFDRLGIDSVGMLM